MFHGTRNFVGQIARNLVASKFFTKELNSLIENNQNEAVTFFAKEFLLSKSRSQTDFLIKPKATRFETLNFEEKKLLGEFATVSTFKSSSRGQINGKSK